MPDEFSISRRRCAPLGDARSTIIGGRCPTRRGHSTTEMTAEVYTHADSEMLRSAVLGVAAAVLVD